MSPPNMIMIRSAMTAACPTRGMGASPLVLTSIVVQSLTSIDQRSFLTLSWTRPPKMSMWPECEGEAGTAKPYRGKGEMGAAGGDVWGAYRRSGRVLHG